MKEISKYGIQLLAVSALQLGLIPVTSVVQPVYASLIDASMQNPAPDNTKTNQRDRRKDEPTADQQKDNKSDRDVTQQIRRAVTQDKSLSTQAHNVKIITQGGVVTLKGPVRSEEEKQAVEAKAKQVAGESNVKSEIQVAAKNTKKKK